MDTTHNPPRQPAAEVIEVTREHWLGKQATGLAPVRISDEAQSARIGPASAPIAA